jgi:hypothetical protein
MHLWIVGILALLWNAMGAWGYTMTMTKNEAAMSEYTPEQIEYAYSMPTWAVACYATAVWFGVLGSLLLLLRKRLAAPVFVVSFIAMVATMVWNHILTSARDVMGDSALAFGAAIFVVALLLAIYSRKMCAKGVLR